MSRHRLASLRIHRNQFRDEGGALLRAQAHVDEDRVVFARCHGAGLGKRPHRVDAVPTGREHPADRRPHVRGVVHHQDARGVGAAHHAGHFRPDP